MYVKLDKYDLSRQARMHLLRFRRLHAYPNFHIPVCCLAPSRVFARTFLTRTLWCTTSLHSAGPTAKVLATLDQYDLLRLEAEKARRKKNGRGRGRGGGGGEGGRGGGRRGGGGGEGGAPAGGREGGDAEGRREGAAGRGQGGGEGSVGAGGEGEGEAAAGGAAAVAGGKRRNDEGAVQSARERYLARKMQKTG